MRVHAKKTKAREREVLDWEVVVPRGMYTDLASVPKELWSIVGPIGTHLEASVVHDYLYMAWTDFRPRALKRDWNFADDVFMAGLQASGVDFLNAISSTPPFVWLVGPYLRKRTILYRSE